MSNEQWVVLSDSEKGQLVSIWLLAADKSGVIPDSPKMIQRMAMLDETPNINKFIELGFLESICQPDGNQEKNLCLQLDAPEESREEEIRGEDIKPNGSNRLPSVPYQKILDLYHEKTTLPRVAVLSDKRKRSIKARWKEELLSDLEAWENYFNYVASTPFLNGSNDRGWTADFDFLIKPETPIKCQEGKYTNEIR